VQDQARNSGIFALQMTDFFRGECWHNLANGALLHLGFSKRDAANGIRWIGLFQPFQQY
jgi:hypothetical protein